MSHAVIRGESNASQRYVDGILAAAGTKTNLATVLFYCMKSWPDDLMMVNGATDEHVSNAQMLGWVVRVARALGGRRLKLGGRGTLMLGVNSPALMTAQLGSIMAGLVPLGLDGVATTLFELQYFLKLWPPSVIFCDPARQADVLQAVKGSLDYSPDVVVLGDGDAWLDQFAHGCSASLEGFNLPTVSPGDTVILLPTTGSTGLAKAAIIQHEALISHLLAIWSRNSTFPRPFRRAMVFSTAQWMTWWSVTTSAIVARVTLVMTSAPLTPEIAWNTLNKYEVNWALMSPTLAARVLEHPARATSLRMILITGAAAHESTLKALQARLPEGGIVRQGYGMTECQGFFSISDEETPLNSVGKPLNIFHYKLIDEHGQECGPNQKGELCIKSDCVIKSYLNNEAAHRESLTADGWMRSGDQFTIDTVGNVYFVERSKFCFKVNNYQVSPEELEAVIASVPGVQHSVVCAVAAGAAALVVCSDPSITRADIHHIVDSQLADYKRLHGGIAFVPSLPLTHNGKLHRRDCLALAEKLLKDKQLYV